MQAAPLEKALAAEQDPEIRAAMQREPVGGAAVRRQQGRTAGGDPRASAAPPTRRSRTCSTNSRSKPDPDPELRKAAEDALASIDSRLRLVGLAANLFQGISLGSVLLLAAIGLAITFGVMGVINMAHGEMIMLGAYAAFVVQQFFRAFLPPGWIGAYLVVAVPVAFLFAGAARRRARTHASSAFSTAARSKPCSRPGASA